MKKGSIHVWLFSGQNDALDKCRKLQKNVVASDDVVLQNLRREWKGFLHDAMSKWKKIGTELSLHVHWHCPFDHTQAFAPVYYEMVEEQRQLCRAQYTIQNEPAWFALADDVPNDAFVTDNLHLKPQWRQLLAERLLAQFREHS